MKILYEDKDIIVIVKPKGLLSQPDNKGCVSVVELLSAVTGSEVHPVHRLDKGTGGVMVYAKNKKSASVLSGQVSKRVMDKIYIAEIHGALNEKSGTMEDLLFFDRRKNKAFTVKRERKGVKKAILEYEVINEGESTSKVKIHLLTGRTHQIRVQFASRGYPLVGDRRYGAKDAAEEIALWASELSFFHPETGERLRFTSAFI